VTRKKLKNYINIGSNNWVDGVYVLSVKQNAERITHVTQELAQADGEHIAEPRRGSRAPLVVGDQLRQP
jgi:hypothetical protein